MQPFSPFLSEEGERRPSRNSSQPLKNLPHSKQSLKKISKIKIERSNTFGKTGLRSDSMASKASAINPGLAQKPSVFGQYTFKIQGEDQTEKVMKQKELFADQVLSPGIRRAKERNSEASSISKIMKDIDHLNPFMSQESKSPKGNERSVSSESFSMSNHSAFNFDTSTKLLGTKGEVALPSDLAVKRVLTSVPRDSKIEELDEVISYDNSYSDDFESLAITSHSELKPQTIVASVPRLLRQYLEKQKQQHRTKKQAKTLPSYLIRALIPESVLFLVELNADLFVQQYQAYMSWFLQSPTLSSMAAQRLRADDSRRMLKLSLCILMLHLHTAFYLSDLLSSSTFLQCALMAISLAIICGLIINDISSKVSLVKWKPASYLKEYTALSLNLFQGSKDILRGTAILLLVPIAKHEMSQARTVCAIISSMFIQNYFAHRICNSQVTAISIFVIHVLYSIWRLASVLHFDEENNLTSLAITGTVLVLQLQQSIFSMRSAILERKKYYILREKLRNLKADYEEVIQNFPQGVMIYNFEEYIDFSQFSAAPSESNNASSQSITRQNGMRKQLKQKLNIKFLNEELKNVLNPEGIQIEMGDLLKQKSFRKVEADGSRKIAENKLMSLHEIIHTHLDEKQDTMFFQFEVNFEVEKQPKKPETQPSCSADQTTVQTGTILKQIVHMEVIVTEITYESKPSYLMIIQNIDHVINNQNQRLQQHYTEAMTATISHEQMNPLNSIINFSQILFEKTHSILATCQSPSEEGSHSLSSDEEFAVTVAREDLRDQSQYLSFIYNSSMQMLLLNQAMVNLTLMKQGKYEGKPRSVRSPFAIINNFALLFEEQMNQKKIKFELNETIYGNMAAVETFKRLGVQLDVDLYKQILYNVFINACKFNKTEGSITMSFQVLPVSEAKHKSVLRTDQLLITTDITDTGIGMNDKQRRRLFKVFESVREQEQKTKKKRDEVNDQGHFKNDNRSSGYGLGLYLSLQLVHFLDGDIEIESHPGIGTKVKISFFADLNKEGEPVREDSSVKLEPVAQLRTCKSLMARQLSMRSQQLEFNLSSTKDTTLLNPNYLKQGQSHLRQRRLSCLPQAINHPMTSVGPSKQLRKSITRSHSSCFKNLEGLHKIVEAEQVDESHSKVNASSSLREDSSLIEEEEQKEADLEDQKKSIMDKIKKQINRTFTFSMPQASKRASNSSEINRVAANRLTGKFPIAFQPEEEAQESGRNTDRFSISDDEQVSDIFLSHRLSKYVSSSPPRQSLFDRAVIQSVTFVSQPNENIQPILSLQEDRFRLSRHSEAGSARINLDVPQPSTEPAPQRNRSAQLHRDENLVGTEANDSNMEIEADREDEGPPFRFRDGQPSPEQSSSSSSKASSSTSLLHTEIGEEEEKMADFNLALNEKESLSVNSLTQIDEDDEEDFCYSQLSVKRNASLYSKRRQTNSTKREVSAESMTASPNVMPTLMGKGKSQFGTYVPLVDNTPPGIFGLKQELKTLSEEEKVEGVSERQEKEVLKEALKDTSLGDVVSMEVQKDSFLEKSASKRSASKRSINSSAERPSLKSSAEKLPREKKMAQLFSEKKAASLRQSMKTPQSNSLVRGDSMPLKRSTTIKSARSSFAQTMSMRMGCHCKKSPILVVDDSVFNQKTLQIMIKEAFGIETDLASHGQEAVEAFKLRIKENSEEASEERKTESKHSKAQRRNSSFIGKKCQHTCKRRHYRLIFMDLQMPIMDGFDATASIMEYQATLKDKADFTECAIIALTAYLNPENIKKCESVGMEEVLNKPASAKVIQEKIQKYCPFLTLTSSKKIE